MAFEVLTPARVESSGEPNDFLDGHVIEEVFVFGNKRHVATDLDTGGDMVRAPAEYPRFSRSGMDHPKQDLERRRLAGAVATEESTDRSGRNLQREPAQRLDVAERFSEISGLDDHFLRHCALPFAEAPPAAPRTSDGFPRLQGRARAIAQPRRRQLPVQPALCRTLVSSCWR